MLNEIIPTSYDYNDIFTSIVYFQKQIEKVTDDEFLETIIKVLNDSNDIKLKEILSTYQKTGKITDEQLNELKLYYFLTYNKIFWRV